MPTRGARPVPLRRGGCRYPQPRHKARFSTAWTQSFAPKMWQEEKLPNTKRQVAPPGTSATVGQAVRLLGTLCQTAFPTASAAPQPMPGAGFGSSAGWHGLGALLRRSSLPGNHRKRVPQSPGQTLASVRRCLTLHSTRAPTAGRACPACAKSAIVAVMSCPASCRARVNSNVRHRKRTVTPTPKHQVAVELLDRAVQMYFAGDSYFAALHLAGAAEEILAVYVREELGADGKPRRTAYDDIHRAAIEFATRVDQTPRKKIEQEIADLMNWPKNSTKHRRGQGDHHVLFDPKSEARIMIDFAISNYDRLTLRLRLPVNPLFARFMAERDA
ncbi:hypothetical protein BurJ1DRAFT_1866 [Burkholderiales bacterium JOSHI_001]|nr:hypothetical protein BurJ1DRAFT_1866 [Burkholderiales bacterium JOSHI_001]